MTLQNTSEKFGTLTKFLHWVIFLLFVIQYYLVYRREYFPKDTNEKLQYILLHKSLGICVLLLAAFMLAWRNVGTRPLMPSNMALIERKAAKITHILLYVAMFIMPLSGIFMSMFGGYKISFFGLFEFPMLFAKNETMGNILYDTHVWSSYLIIGLVAIHASAALYHHFVRKDNVLRRMI
ncbi:MAG: cytochrome b [Candidatus Berkiella sp.]